MDFSFENRLVFVLPKEKHEYVKRIVEAVINDEDEFLVDDMLVDDYEAIIDERDELAKQIRNSSEKAGNETVEDEFGYEKELNIEEYNRIKNLYLDISKELEQTKQKLYTKNERLVQIQVKLTRIKKIIQE